MPILEMLKELQINETFSTTQTVTVIENGKKKKKRIRTKKTRRVLVKDGKRKTCVLGFVTTVHSIFDLAQELFEEGNSLYN